MCKEPKQKNGLKLGMKYTILMDQGFIDDTEFSMNPTTAYEKYGLRKQTVV